MTEAVEEILKNEEKAIKAKVHIEITNPTKKVLEEELNMIKECGICITELEIHEKIIKRHAPDIN